MRKNGFFANDDRPGKWWFDITREKSSAGVSTLPELACGFFCRTFEAFLELTRVGQSTLIQLSVTVITKQTLQATYQDTSPHGCMRIAVYPVNCSLLSNLPAPPAGIRHEEELLLAKVLQARQKFCRVIFLSLFPGAERCAQAAGIRDVLAKCESTVDVERFVVRAGDGEVRVLFDKALCLFLE